jgi:hypothetical protein
LVSKGIPKAITMRLLKLRILIAGCDSIIIVRMERFSTRRAKSFLCFAETVQFAVDIAPATFSTGRIMKVDDWHPNATYSM